MKFFKNLSGDVKLITAILALVITIGGVVIAAEDRYVTDKEAATSLQMFDQKIQYNINDIKTSILRKELSYVEERYYKLRSLVLQHPEDIELSLEFNELKDKRIDLIEELK
jgi:hypothetical protein